MLHQTTPVPNEIFDLHFPNLSHVELRILLIVVRQTYGWKDSKTGKRKQRDRLTYGFLIKKTGLYRTVLSQAIQSLIIRGLLIVSDYDGKPLMHPHERQGKHFLYYQHVRNFNQADSQSDITPVRHLEHNKTNTLKKKTLSKEQLTENLERLEELKAGLFKS
jgi:hypothetical protein